MKKDILTKGLLETKAISIDIENPFTFVSGILSPVYVDCRKLLSYPKIRDEITKGFIEIIKNDIGLSNIDVVAGGETAGIPFAAFLAPQIDKPMIYVRKKPKGYGQNSQIEGLLKEGQKVVLVEDVITEGDSKLKFNIGIKGAGANMTHCLCVFSYESPELGLSDAKDRLKKFNIKLHSLANWDDVIQTAREGDYWSDKEIDLITEFLKDPESWGRKKGYE